MDAAIAVLRAQGAYVELIQTYDQRIGMPQLGTCIARPSPTDVTAQWCRGAPPSPRTCLHFLRCVLVKQYSYAGVDGPPGAR